MEPIRPKFNRALEVSIGLSLRVMENMWSRAGHLGNTLLRRMRQTASPDSEQGTSLFEGVEQPQLRVITYSETAGESSEWVKRGLIDRRRPDVELVLHGKGVMFRRNRYAKRPEVERRKVERRSKMAQPNPSKRRLT